MLHDDGRTSCRFNEKNMAKNFRQFGHVIVADFIRCVRSIDFCIESSIISEDIVSLRSGGAVADIVRLHSDLGCRSFFEKMEIHNSLVLNWLVRTVLLIRIAHVLMVLYVGLIRI